MGSPTSSASPVIAYTTMHAPAVRSRISEIFAARGWRAFLSARMQPVAPTATKVRSVNWFTAK